MIIDEVTAASIVVAATFLLLPTLGEIIVQRSGVLNLGVEGMIITSAAGSYYVMVQMSHLNNGASFLGGVPSVWVGLLAGIIFGILISLIHAVVTVSLNRNQIVTGIGLTIFGTGFSGLIGRDVTSVRGDRNQSFQTLPIPILEDIPFFGPVFFQQNIFVYISLILVPVTWFILFRTKYGIIIRTTGENPMAAHNQGINVVKVRYGSIIFGGAMAGLGGAYLSIAWLQRWNENLTNSRGWIVIALVIVALWHPIIALIGSYVFGAFWIYQSEFASGITIFSRTVTIDPAITKMFPYLSTLLFLIIGSIILNRSKVKRIIGAPSSLTVPFYAD